MPTTSTSANIDLCFRVCVFVCVRVRMRVRAGVCMCMCVYLCLCVCMCICVSGHVASSRVFGSLAFVLSRTALSRPADTLVQPCGGAGDSMGPRASRRATWAPCGLGGVRVLRGQSQSAYTCAANRRVRIPVRAGVLSTAAGALEELCYHGASHP